MAATEWYVTIISNPKIVINLAIRRRYAKYQALHGANRHANFDFAELLDIRHMLFSHNPLYLIISIRGRIF